MTHSLFAGLDALVEQGLLRRLGVAFARFVCPPERAFSMPLAVVCALLSEMEGRGHSCLNLEELAADPCALLGWDEAQWQALLALSGPLPRSAQLWRQGLADCPQVWLVGQLDFNQPLILDQERLYLRRYWRCETAIAKLVNQRATTERAVDPSRVRLWLDRLFQANASPEPDWQKIACAVAVRRSIAIITGGPGTGKTYTVARLLALLFALAEDPTRLRVALAAPTGKAAARLKQAIDEALGGLAQKVGDCLPLADLTASLPAAGTLHSLLGARPDTRALRYHAGNLLEIDVLIVDEASMIHLEMMASLLQALPPTTMVILLGDKDQLASVEAGAVLGDLCNQAELGAYSDATAAYVLQASGEVIPPAMLQAGAALAQQTVMLRTSRRFGGPIGALALAVNAGDPASCLRCLRAAEEQALHWSEHASREQVLQLAMAGRLGAEGGYGVYLEQLQQNPLPCSAAVFEIWVHRCLKAFDTFRILCAVRAGEWGINDLNLAIEQRFEAAGLIRRRGEWYVGRPVMATRNDTSIGVFNGDIGIALEDPMRTDSLRVYFLQGEGVRSVLASRLTHVETTYAMTVHKVQGSEFQHVVLVLPATDGPLVSRELVYTAITRAREHFTLLTSGSSNGAAGLEQAILRKTQRASGLQALLARSGV